MKSIREQFEKIGVVGKKRGAKYAWQDQAARMAKELGFKPTANWFLLFKRAYNDGRQGILGAAFTYVVDSRHPNPEKLFYKVYYLKLKGEWR